MKRRSTLSTLLIVLILAVFLILYRSQNPTTSTPPASATPTVAHTAPKWGVQTKTSGSMAHDGLPDSACTPGDIFPDATKEKICVPGYARSVRDVPQSLKNKVYDEYGITRRLPGQYEVDHLVSLQLGGSNDIANLWPEAASPKRGVHEKDSVENYLQDQICSGAN